MMEALACHPLGKSCAPSIVSNGSLLASQIQSKFACNFPSGHACLVYVSPKSHHSQLSCLGHATQLLTMMYRRRSAVLSRLALRL